jgi:hypothetical protein
MLNVALQIHVVLRFSLELKPARMKPSLEKRCFSRRQLLALWAAISLLLYVLSTGPVAWATNDAFHPAYLPEQVEWIYFPLAPLGNIECVGNFFDWWTVVVWQGWPAGYTTL